MTPKTFRASLAALAVAAFAALALAAPALAQSADDPARRAAALDRALGPNADLPVPQIVNVPNFAWPQRPYPPWLTEQPYRQQPLLTAVPRGGTVGGRTRGSGVP
jgi:hypothetical protein